MGFLPGWLLQGRVGITAPCTAAPAHLPSHPLGPAHHGLPAEQSKEGFREPSSLYITLPPRIHYPRALHHSVLSPIQDHWVVTAIPRHSHQVSATQGLANAGLLWHHLTFSPVSPSSPGAPRSPWYRKSTGSGAAGPLGDILDPGTEPRSLFSLPKAWQECLLGPCTTHLPALFPRWPPRTLQRRTETLSPLV